MQDTSFYDCYFYEFTSGWWKISHSFISCKTILVRRWSGQNGLEIMDKWVMNYLRFLIVICDTYRPNLFFSKKSYFCLKHFLTFSFIFKSKIITLFAKKKNKATEMYKYVPVTRHFKLKWISIENSRITKIPQTCYTQ